MRDAAGARRNCDERALRVRAGFAGAGASAATISSAARTFARGLIPQRGILREAALHDRPEWCGKPRGQWVRFIAQNRGADLERCRATERPAAGDHFVQHDAERPDVAAPIGGCPLEEFGRQISQRAGDAARRRGHSRRRIGSRFSHQGCDPEIQYLHPPVGGHHQIAALEIAVDDSALVRVRERVRDLYAITNSR